MSNKSDIEIAQAARMANIVDIAKSVGLDESELQPYGNYKAKVDLKVLDRLSDRPDGKLILVTAINPTPAGEGKTTTSVGLADAMRRLGKNTVLALREPSLGPVFGMKGGATGGGRAQVLPMEDINLHFTGDFHAVGAANNLLAAIVDNHIHHGNNVNIDSLSVTWRRCIDMNDRQLRFIVSGLSGKSNGSPREDGFDITAASEVMAVLCLSRNIAQLKQKLGKIIVGHTTGGAPVTAGDLNAHGAMAALLKDAIKPNLVQTIEGTPVFVHGGPFANIAHGCNSLAATRLALKLGDYAVTEAGFGADLGAEKFIDIKCRIGGLKPSACVIVATARALKYHGGVPKANLKAENLKSLESGLPNLYRHIENIKNVFGLPVVVAINRFPDDSESEMALICDKCNERGALAVVSEVWGKGGEGGVELASAVIEAIEAAAGGAEMASTDIDAKKTAAGGAEMASADIDAIKTAAGGAEMASTDIDAKKTESGIVGVIDNTACGVQNGDNLFRFAYDEKMPILEKIETIARSIYGAEGVDFASAAKKEAAKLKKAGFSDLPVCVAKTQFSFTGDPKIYGAPSGFRISVKQLKVQAGAGFIIAYTDDIMTMPGLPATPAAEQIDVDDSGTISGLF